MLINELNIHTGKELGLNDLEPGKVVSYNDQKFNNVVKFIAKNCSEFLAQRKSCQRFLYRGFTAADVDFFVSQSRDVRDAIDGPLSSKYKNLADFYMSNAGFTALRGNSTFCNSLLSSAANYANESTNYVYFIFPVNGFSYAYSTMHTGSSAARYDFPKVNGFEPPTVPENLSNGLIQKLSQKFVKTNKLTNKNLKFALSKEQDVWIRGKFVAVNFKKYHEDIYKKFGNSFMPEDISYVDGTTEQQQMAAISAGKIYNLANIKNPSFNVEKFAVEQMFQRNNFAYINYIKSTKAQIYAIYNDDKTFMLARRMTLTPEAEKYAKENGYL